MIEYRTFEMARKNIFENIMREDAEDSSHSNATGFTKFGAAKSISSSIDELARQASKIVEGQTVLDIDPNLIDGSFVSDRMDEKDEAFQDLLAAVKERGQDTPVLVRPHPASQGRYQIVFGHRRVKVAQQLGRQVRAVVKQLEDIDHIIAQGQENSARANLSFIERVMFAQRLSDLGYTREIIMSALTVDYQTLSKMLTIPRAIPEAILDTIGPARKIGRDRWLELRKLMENPTSLEGARSFVASQNYLTTDSDDRFELLFNFLNGGRKKSVKKAVAPRVSKAWAPSDKSVTVTAKANGKAFDLALRNKDAVHFGGWISENLDELYRAFRESENVRKIGD
jgi:ParB family transcriptional regulator, chromosome partitioning protein